MLESAELRRGIAEVRKRIDAAAARADRRPEEVRLIGVTKKVPRETVQRAAEAGLTEFGENYVQELAQKREAAPDATWHFIGRLQRNKARATARLFDVVHTLDRPELGRASCRERVWIPV